MMKRRCACGHVQDLATYIRILLIWCGADRRSHQSLTEVRILRRNPTFATTVLPATDSKPVNGGSSAVNPQFRRLGSVTASTTTQIACLRRLSENVVGRYYCTTLDITSAEETDLSANKPFSETSRMQNLVRNRPVLSACRFGNAIIST